MMSAVRRELIERLVIGKSTWWVRWHMDSEAADLRFKYLNVRSLTKLQLMTLTVLGPRAADAVRSPHPTKRIP